MRRRAPVILRPKNWGEFQHYKDRSPPWIRLHRSLLDDYEFHCLPVASKALAPMLWLVAACSENTKTGEFDATPKKMAFRLRMTEAEFVEACKPLIDGGFFSVVDDASGVLAERKRDAVPETETETETEGERENPADPELTTLAALDADPEPDSAASRPRRSPVEIRTWIDGLPPDEDPINADDPIVRYGESIGVPIEFLVLCWDRFVDDQQAKRTRKKDWRAHFRNAVKGNWYKLWWFDQQGVCRLTTQGEQARRAAA